jgi:hypothetical protein
MKSSDWLLVIHEEMQTHHFQFFSFQRLLHSAFEYFKKSCLPIRDLPCSPWLKNEIKRLVIVDP